MNDMPPIEQPVAVREAALPAHVEQTMDDFIAMALRDASIDVGKLKALLDMKASVIAEQARVEFYEALRDAQGEIPQVEKNGVVRLIAKDGKDLGSYNFAKWEDIDTVLRPILKRHNFSLNFDMEPRATEGGGAKMIATLTHAQNGRTHSIDRSVSLALDSGAGRNNLQAMGSTISYAKRYLAEMLFNIVRKGADDDGKLGGMKFAKAEHVERIEALITETGTNEGQFLQYYQAAHIGSLTEDQAVAAINMLESKKRKMAKAPA